MKIVGLLMVGAVAACGGAIAQAGTGDPAVAPDPTNPGGSNGNPPSSDPPPKSSDEPGLGGDSCPYPTRVLVASGGTIARPAGSALRLELVYQGWSIGVTSVRGVDGTLPPPSGPFTAGQVAGYWIETRSGATTTYQHAFRDPTLDADPGGFGTALPLCSPKSILAELPNDGTTEVIVYGSSYGSDDVAEELARFTVK
jgi:hypothetical protein